ncbi:MAG: putative quinol monooxygenase [Flavobacteriales bacterium]
MTIRTEEIDRFIQLFEVHREAISSMPGCTELKLLNQIEPAGTFFTFSIWQSESDLERYRKSLLFQGIWPQVKALFHCPAEAWTVNEILSCTV